MRANLIRAGLLMTGLLVLAGGPARAGVKGKASVSGAAGKAEPVKMQADPKCAALHTGGFSYAPVAAGAQGGLANVFVYVKKGLEGKKFTPPAEAKAILDQRGCWYHPRVSGIMVGQKLEILNSDPTMHNVNANPDFNAAMPPTVKKLEKSFKKPKVMFRIKCNVHPWMTSYVGVLEHPFYAVTGPDGSYSIEGLPAGKYTLEAWHEKLGSKTAEITVDAKGSASADFSFGGAAKAGGAKG